MWSPGVAALITRLLNEGTTRDVGWQWWRTRYQILSYLIPIGYACVAYVLVWATWLGGFYNVAFINAQAADLGWFALPAPLQLLIYGSVAGTIVMASSCATALGEEIGWRGSWCRSWRRSQASRDSPC